MCRMAGTMIFSEVPPYTYTCRSLHRVRTGKMRTKQPFAAPAPKSALASSAVSKTGHFDPDQKRTGFGQDCTLGLASSLNSSEFLRSH